MEPPKVTIEQGKLDETGFTSSGISKFKDVIGGYVANVFNKAVHYGHADKGEGMDVEVTHDHVRSAAYSIATSYGKPPKSGWMIAANISEYLFMGLAGAGYSHLDNPYGISAASIGTAIVVILVAYRLIKS